MMEWTEAGSSHWNLPRADPAEESEVDLILDRDIR